MEFVEGHTLGYWMHARTRSWPEVLEVFSAAGRGLAAAHERDLVHRDFKPDNVMIGADGQVRVMDFGLVQIAGERTAERRRRRPRRRRARRGRAGRRDRRALGPARAVSGPTR